MQCTAVLIALIVKLTTSYLDDSVSVLNYARHLRAGAGATTPAKTPTKTTGGRCGGKPCIGRKRPQNTNNDESAGKVLNVAAFANGGGDFSIRVHRPHSSKNVSKGSGSKPNSTASNITPDQTNASAFKIHDDDGGVESAFIKSIDWSVHKPVQFEHTYNPQALADQHNYTVIEAMGHIFGASRFVKVNGSLDDSKNAVHSIRPDISKKFEGWKHKLATILFLPQLDNSLFSSHIRRFPPLGHSMKRVAEAVHSGGHKFCALARDNWT